MRTVDFDAEVTEWQDQQADVDLPSNLQTFAAGSVYNVTLPAGDDVYDYEFAITGLDINESVGFTTNATTWTSAATENPANGAGIATQKITIAKNTTVINRNNVAQHLWTGASSGKKVWLDITQLAGPLGLGITTPTAGTATATVTKTTSSEWATCITDVTNQNQIKVWRNDQLLNVQAGSPSADNQVQFSAETLTFNTNLVAGDNIKVWIKAGDAAAETKTAVAQ